MRVALDAFGGDNAPLAAIKGAVLAKEEFGTEIILCGDSEKIKSVALENEIDISAFTVLDADGTIEIEDDPADILKKKRKCSMGVAFDALCDGTADAAVSAGSTAALVVGGSLIVKRIKGIKRCALAAIIPSYKDPFLMLDVGANIDIKPEYLLQYGIMGSCYYELVMGKKNPTVKLLNIGTEECKGGELHTEGYKLLKDSTLNFCGNIEGREIMDGDCDVIVTDGFSGNIALKTIEGVAGTFFKMIKEIFLKSTLTKLSVLPLKNGLKGLKNKTDYTAVGGAPLLGTCKPLFKAHGSSNEVAFKNAIRNAELFAERGVIEKIEGNL